MPGFLKKKASPSDSSEGRGKARDLAVVAVSLLVVVVVSAGVYWYYTKDETVTVTPASVPPRSIVQKSSDVSEQQMQPTQPPQVQAEPAFDPWQTSGYYDRDFLRKKNELIKALEIATLEAKIREMQSKYRPKEEKRTEERGSSGKSNRKGLSMEEVEKIVNARVNMLMQKQMQAQRTAIMNQIQSLAYRATYRVQDTWYAVMADGAVVRKGQMVAPGVYIADIGLGYVEVTTEDGLRFRLRRAVSATGFAQSQQGLTQRGPSSLTESLPLSGGR